MSDASNTVPETKSETPKTALDQWVTWMRSSYFGVAFVAACSCILEIKPLLFLIFPPVFVLALWGVGQVAKKMYGDKLDRSLDELHMKTQKVTVDGFLQYFDHVQKHRLYIASASLVVFLLAIFWPTKPSYEASLAVCILGACLSYLWMHKNGISIPEALKWSNIFNQRGQGRFVFSSTPIFRQESRAFSDTYRPIENFNDPYRPGTAAYHSRIDSYKSSFDRFR